MIEIELKMELPQGGTISLKPLSHSCPSHFALHFFISGVSIASAKLMILVKDTTVIWKFGQNFFSSFKDTPAISK